MGFEEIGPPYVLLICSVFELPFNVERTIGLLEQTTLLAESNNIADPENSHRRLKRFSYRSFLTRHSCVLYSLERLK